MTIGAFLSDLATDDGDHRRGDTAGCGTTEGNIPSLTHPAQSA